MVDENGKRDADLRFQAHWFDMEKFWVEAAKVVRPGGTVALWTLCKLVINGIEEWLLIILQRLPSFVSICLAGTVTLELSLPPKEGRTSAYAQNRSRYPELRKDPRNPSPPRKTNPRPLRTTRQHHLHEHVRRSSPTMDHLPAHHRIP